MILKVLGPWSVDHGREPCRLISAQGLQSFKLHLSRLQRPLVVLFEHHGTDESDNGLVIGEDTDDVGASLHLGIDPFQRVGTVNLGSVCLGEAHEGQHFMFGVVHLAGQLGKFGPQPVGHSSPLATGYWLLATGRLRRLLYEDGIDHGQHSLALAFASMR